MKDLFVRLAFLGVMLIVIPCIMLTLICNNNRDDVNYYRVKIYNCKTDEIMDMNIEEYISGVVSAEMPASFDDEALKSQAVAARTYALRKINKDAPEHKGADLCTDFAHCQAYYDKKESEKVWGNKANSYAKKIKNSVKSTSGEYLSYNNEFASTVFHACSNGTTENSADVWGGSFPYLICVDSPGDVQNPNYVTRFEIGKTEFVDKLNQAIGKEKIKEESLTIEEPELTDGGNVRYIDISGEKFKGTDIRKIFGLKSTSFTLEFEEEKIVFCVYGSGHGVGMSQYGAQGMALSGEDYKKILSHYYPGTVLEKMYK